MVVELSTIITAAAAVLVAIITGVITVIAGRPKATADIQSAITSASAMIIDKLRDTIKDQDERIAELEAMVKRQRDREAILLQFMKAKSIDPPGYD